MDERYLNEIERNHCKSTPEAYKDIVSFARTRFKNITKNYTLSANRDILEPDDKEELRIVVVGKTGVGKSATANTILGKPNFKEDMEAKSITVASSCGTEIINGRKVRVIDTPGLFDTNQKQDVVLQEIARVIQIFDSGIHAFVYVLNMASPRFTEEDSETLKTVEEKFGGDIKRYRLIVYSHADNNLDDKMDLDKFVNRQKNSNPLLKKVFEESSNNIVALNNITSIPAEKTRNQEVIIKMIDKIRKSNKSCPVYTNETFKIATKQRKDLADNVRQNGWSPQVMSALQSVYESNLQLFRNPRKLKEILTKGKRRAEKVQKGSAKPLSDTEALQKTSSSSGDPKNKEEGRGEDEIDHTDLGEIPDDIAESTSYLYENQFKEIGKRLLDISKSLQDILWSLWQKKGLSQ